MKVQELFEEIQNDRLLFGTPKHLRMFSIVLEASSADLQAFLERLPEHYPELTWKKEVDPKKPSGVDHSPDRRRKTA